MVLKVKTRITPAKGNEERIELIEIIKQNTPAMRGTASSGPVPLKAGSTTGSGFFIWEIPI